VWRYPGLFWCSVMAWTGGLLYALNLFMRVRITTRSHILEYHQYSWCVDETNLSVVS
jgi:DUF1365 family protein